MQVAEKVRRQPKRSWMISTSGGEQTFAALYTNSRNSPENSKPHYQLALPYLL